MNPMVMLSLVTPGALAVFDPDEDPVADPVVPPVVPPDEFDELFDELLQAAVSTAKAATMTAALIPRRFIAVPPYVIDGTAQY
jgi:hypothetical protein